MAKVMIKCPETGKLVPAGVWVDKATFEKAQMPQNTLGRCPACGKKHSWTKKDAVLQD